MKLIIEINLDNAAFDDNCGGEVSKILRKQVFACETTKRAFFITHHGIPLKDTNGNTVGKITLEGYPS